MLQLDWIAVAFSLTGIVLNAKKNIWCWPIWVIANTLWIIISVTTNDVPQTVLWTVFNLFNLYGWYSWLEVKDRSNMKLLEKITDFIEDILISLKESLFRRDRTRLEGLLLQELFKHQDNISEETKKNLYHYYPTLAEGIWEGDKENE